MSDTLIEVSGLSKRFRSKRRTVQALGDVSFSVASGEAFGFIGPNGAGKSTTIKILLDIVSDYDGSVVLNGYSARDAKARIGVGYVPESPALYDMLTPLDLLMMAVSMHRSGHDNPKKLCLDWLERFSVAHVAKRRIRELSKGTAQRVALAHAFVVSPRLLILDEPLSGLDPIGRKDVVDIIADYRRSGGTVFFTSHVLHDVERVADRFALIHRGRLRTVRSPSELLGENQMVSVRTVGTHAVEGMRADFDGRWVTEIASGHLWDLLARLRAAGHAIIEVRPMLSLEAAFMRFIEDDIHGDVSTLAS